jgi:hypothetical protein
MVAARSMGIVDRIMDAGWFGLVWFIGKRRRGSQSYNARAAEILDADGKKLREAFLHIRLPKPEQCS